MNENSQKNGDNEVHREGCYWLTLVKDKRYLGDFYDCEGAVSEALLHDPDADGCKHCSPDCHNS